MAASFTLPTVLANLAAGNQALSLIDADLNALANPLLALNTFANYYADTGAANAYVITVSAPQTVSQVVGLPITFLAAHVNTGASTLQINALAVKNIKNPDGTALSAGEIPLNALVTVIYDGTQYQLQSISGPSTGSSITLGTPQATTSGTSFDFTVPTATKRVTIMLTAVSTNGTSNLLFQLGDAGGIETTTYVGNGVFVGATTGIANYTTGFGIDSAGAAEAVTGKLVIDLENASTFTCVASGIFTRASNDFIFMVSGRKATSQELTTVRLTTVNGTDAFDAGEVNCSYER